MKRIAIFASGTGSNALKIIEYFKDRKEVHVDIIMSNNPGAKVLESAKELNLPYEVLDKARFKETDHYISKLKDLNIDIIVLAGFLWLIPKNLIQTYSGRILNIHPSLLPKYGGKGMYGQHVHEAVFKAGEHVSGMTIHLVNAKFDDGKILFQSMCDIGELKCAEEIARTVLRLEHTFYPKIIDIFIQTQKRTCL